MRDITAAYKRALIEEHEGYVRAGRAEDAEHVAGVLREQYGHQAAPDAPERADVERPPEDTAKPKPTRTAKRPAARKPSAGG